MRRDEGGRRRAEAAATKAGPGRQGPGRRGRRRALRLRTFLRKHPYRTGAVSRAPAQQGANVFTVRVLLILFKLLAAVANETPCGVKLVVGVPKKTCVILR